MTHCEVGRMGEQDCPAVIDPLMPVHGALSGVRFEVWDNIAQAKYLRNVKACQVDHTHRANLT